MSPDSPAAPNPYVGPDAIPENGHLFGRRQETEDVRDLLTTGRILLLYGPSGAGKTSLLQAGLIPELRRDGRLRIRFVQNFRPVPGADGVGNRYLASIVGQLSEVPPQGRSADGASPPPPDSLDGLLRGLAGDGATKAGDGTAEVLILDHFEQVFTLDPLDLEARRAFLQGLGEALRDHSRLALLCIREAHLAKLDPYLHLFPNGLKNRFRLGLLDYASALEAIQMGGRVPYEPGAAEALLQNLWEARRRAEEAAQEAGVADQRDITAPIEGDWVEPALLQVTCANLWEACGSSGPIGKADVTRPDLSVEQAIGAYYARAAQTTAAEGKTPERDIRDWLEERLITPGGAHGEALHDPATGWGLPDAALEALEASHLIRLEAQGGRRRYELTNDLLIGPILGDNGRWRARTLAPLQREARQWQRHGRPDRSLLSTGKWLRTLPWRYANRGRLRPEEVEYWRASTRTLALGRLLPLLLVVLSGASVWQQIEHQRLRLEEQAIMIKLFRAKDLALEREVDHALVLSAEAASDLARLTRRHKADTLESAVRDTLLSVLLRVGDVRRVFVADDEVFQAVAFHPASLNPLVAYGGMDGRLHVAGLAEATEIAPMAVCPTRGSAHNQVASLAFDPAGRWLAAGCESGEVAVWSTEDWKERDRWQAHRGKVWALAVNRDGRLLASGSSNEDKVRIMVLGTDGRRIGPGAPPDKLDVAPIGHVWSLAFSPVADMLFVGDGVGALWSCDLEPAQPACRKRLAGEPDKLPGENDAVRAIAFHPDGSHLALGYWKGGVQVRRADFLPEEKPLPIDVGRTPGSVQSLLFFTADSRPYLAIGRGKRVLYRPVPSDPASTPEQAAISPTPPPGAAPVEPTAKAVAGQAKTPRRLASVGDEAYALAFHERSKTLAAATRGGYVAILDPLGEHDRARHIVDLGADNTERLRAAMVPGNAGVMGLLVALPATQPEGNLALVTLRDGVPEPPLYPILAAGSGQIRRLAASAQGIVATWEERKKTDGRPSGHAISVWTLHLEDREAGLKPILTFADADFPGLVPRRLALSPDGALLVCAFEDSGKLLVAPVDQSGKLDWTETGLAKVREIAFSHDGRYFAAGGVPAGDRTAGQVTDRIVVWDVAPTGLAKRDAEPMFMTPLAETVTVITFAANEQGAPVVVAGGQYGQIDVWDLESGRHAQTLRANSRPVWHVAYEPAASLLAAADNQGVLRLWSTAQWTDAGQQWDGPMQLSPSTDEIRDPGFLAFGPGGGWLASVTDRIEIWDIGLDSLRKKVCSLLRDRGQHGADSPVPTPWVCKDHQP